MYATTRQFLDYFNLKSLDQLPPLAEIKELDNLSGELGLETPQPAGDASDDTATDGGDTERGADRSGDDEGSASLAESGDEDSIEQRADDGEENNTVG